MEYRFVKPLMMGTLLLFLLAIKSYAQQDFVYLHNNLWVSGFSVNPNGSLTQVPGSPYPTGWIGSRSDYFGVNRIIVAGNFLYASDGLASLIRGYSINPETGSLTPVSALNLGSSSTNGISLAITPDNHFLFAANAQLGTISIIRIGNDGSLTNMTSSPVSSGGNSDGIKVTPNGRFLAVTLPFIHGIAMFNIASDGSLSPVSGSPFTTSGLDSGPASIDISCDSGFLFVGQASILPLSAISTTVDVFTIAANGVLTPISGSPFKPGVGFDANVVLLSRDDTRLFVTNQGSHTVTVFNVAPNGSLSLVQGSPFHDNGFPLQPSGMATNQAGTLLLATNLIDTVSIFDIGSAGTLTPTSSSPFELGIGNGSLLSLVAYPAKTCGPVLDLCIQDDSSGSIFRFNSTTGDYQFTICSGFTLSGTGSLVKKGSMITLQHYAPDRRVLARIDTSVKKATASIQVFSQGTMFTITDRNTSNNTCACATLPAN